MVGTTLLLGGLRHWEQEYNLRGANAYLTVIITLSILGLVLGGLIEDSFMTSMIKADGDILAFFERPVSAVLGTVTILIWLSPQLVKVWRKIRRVRPMASR